MKGYRTTDLNLSASFVLPLVDISRKALITNYRLHNTYLYDEQISAYRSGYVFLVHKNIQDKGFEEFEDTLINNDNFIDSYDIAETRFGVKIYKIPEEYSECLAILLAGGYSRVAQKTKDKLLQNCVTNVKFVRQILYKSPELRLKIEQKLSSPGSPAFLNNQEVWQKINLEKEGLTEERKRALLKSKLEPSGEFK
jgi:hypothetical protein